MSAPSSSARTGGGVRVSPERKTPSRRSQGGAVPLAGAWGGGVGGGGGGVRKPVEAQSGSLAGRLFLIGELLFLFAADVASPLMYARRLGCLVLCVSVVVCGSEGKKFSFCAANDCYSPRKRVTSAVSSRVESAEDLRRRAASKWPRRLCVVGVVWVGMGETREVSDCGCVMSCESKLARRRQCLPDRHPCRSDPFASLRLATGT